MQQSNKIDSLFKKYGRQQNKYDKTSTHNSNSS